MSKETAGCRLLGQRHSQSIVNSCGLVNPGASSNRTSSTSSSAAERLLGVTAVRGACAGRSSEAILR
eukprot:484159-Amphidinium_carterae.2